VNVQDWGSHQFQDDPVAVFAETARRYCEFVDAAASLDLDERLHRARLELSRLVHAACHLPAGDADAPDVDTDVSIPTNWPGFGDLDLYQKIFDPYVDEAPVWGSLSDDVLDIYRDLQCGLVAYDAGQVGAAVWHWRWDFDHHWGAHAVDALQALHRACYR
jgi:hypothetical protein